MYWLFIPLHIGPFTSRYYQIHISETCVVYCMISLVNALAILHGDDDHGSGGHFIQIFPHKFSPKNNGSVK